MTATHTTARWWRSWVGASSGQSPARRVLVDAALALVLGLVAGLVDVLGPDHNGAGAALWDLALAAPLALRRSSPVLTAVLVGLVCLAQWWAATPVMGDVAVLAALYTLAAHGRHRWLLGLAIVTAELGVVMAVTRWQSHENVVLPSLMLTGTVTAAWVAGIYARTHRAWTASLQERAETAERERDSQALVAVAAERARIARELHDVVAHSLSVMITLNDAAAAVGTPGPSRDTVEQASEVGRQALAEMQRLLGVLREESGSSAPTPQPTTDQLAALVALVRSAGPDVELQTVGDLSTVPASLQLAAYRIVQESLTNVLKHGRNVGRVRVVVARHDDSLELSVQNDGEPALDPDPAGSTPGLGLTGMRERVRLFGGDLVTGPAAGRGWRVEARLPIPGDGGEPAPTTTRTPLGSAAPDLPEVQPAR